MTVPASTVDHITNEYVLCHLYSGWVVSIEPIATLGRACWTHVHSVVFAAPLAFAWLADTDPGRVRARKHSRHSCDTRHNDEGDHEQSTRSRIPHYFAC